MVIIGKIYEAKRPSSDVGKTFNFKLNIYNKIRPIKMMVGLRIMMS